MINTWRKKSPVGLLFAHWSEKNLENICYNPQCLELFGGIAWKKFFFLNPASKLWGANERKRSVSSLHRNRKSDYLTRDGFISLNGDWLLSTKDTERRVESGRVNTTYFRWQSSDMGWSRWMAVNTKLVMGEASSSS